MRPTDHHRPSAAVLQAAFLFLAAVALSVGASSARAEAPSEPPAAINDFVSNHCTVCHDDATREADLDLTALSFDLSDPQAYARWEQIFDRVSKGEMPPAEMLPPSEEELASFKKHLDQPLLVASRERQQLEGRATVRRLNRLEYEDTLRDLLGLPILEVKEFLPEDPLAYGFNKVGDALDVSHVQMNRYLSAADFALRQAVASQVDPPETRTERYYTWDQRRFNLGPGPVIRQTFRLKGYDVVPRPRRRRGRGEDEPPPDPNRDRSDESVAVVVSTYEPTEIQFSSFQAPKTGRYRLTFSAFTIWMALDFKQAFPGRRDEQITIYSDAAPSIYRRLGGFDIGPEPTVNTIDVWMNEGESIRPDASRLVRCRPPDFKNPDAEEDGMPGVAFQWMEVEGPIIDQWPPQGHQVMFGELPIEPAKTEVQSGLGVSVVSEDPAQDAPRLLKRFMEQACRRPVSDLDVQLFLPVFEHAQHLGHDFTESMLAAYTAVLCSPGFLYFHDEPGPLSDLALAERLSYFLWNSTPDAELRDLAVRGRLRDPEVLRQQTDRLLDDPRSDRFVTNFLDYWLDLRFLWGTTPDIVLYPEYELDDMLNESMLMETQRFFDVLVVENLPASNIVDSDFVMINQRLARHYGIEGVEGIDIRRVELPEDSVRGGLMTQASVMKVTANGTTTSPVIRGTWVLSRILGTPPPPPPPSVPAVEPDTRGATTIREQLAKHRSTESCNACHQHIDPPGFALENFDVMGAFQTRYRSFEQGQPAKGVGHNGQLFEYKLGPEVDSSGELIDGREFEDIRGLKECLLQDPDQIARNLVEQLTVYATGAPIQYADRPRVEAILDATCDEDFGVRSLIHEIVQSEMFLNK